MVEPRPERVTGAVHEHRLPFPTTVPIPTADDGTDRPGLHVRLFGSHMFFRLWLAQVVSALGDWLGFLGITILAARLPGAGGGGAAVGLVMAARIIPGFFLAPVAGVLVDRWNRKRVMVTCDLMRAAVVATLPFVDTVVGLVLASFILEIGTLLWSPSKEASVPNLVPPERLTSANSLSLAAAYGTFPVATALFTLLAGAAQALGRFDLLDPLRVNPESLAFYVDALTFMLSALMISTLGLPDQERLARREDNGNGSGKRIDFAQTFHEFKEGWHYLFINPVVRAVNVGLATGLIGGGMIVPVGSVFSIQVLGQNPSGFGVFVTALGFGVAVGILAVSLGQRWVPKAEAFTISLLVAGVSLMLAASMTSLRPAALFVAILGVCAGSVYVLGFTLLHENVEDELRGRIFAALYTLVRLCLLIAFAVGPFLSELFDNLGRDLFEQGRVHIFDMGIGLYGSRVTLWLAGLIILGASLLSALSLRAGRVSHGQRPVAEVEP
ncbi:MAG: MFS transporter [Acidimicrobiales bacterium]